MSHIVTRTVESPIDQLRIAATGRGVCLLEFTEADSPSTKIDALAKRFGFPASPGTNEHLDRLEDELGRYFDGKLTEFGVALDIKGTPFQETVWSELSRISYGRTVSYGQLAERIGRPGAQRAVGRANGDNRIAIVIPCHRVVQSDGALGGYGGWLWRKQFLLDLESATLGQMVKATPAGHEAASV